MSGSKDSRACDALYPYSFEVKKNRARSSTKRSKHHTMMFPPLPARLPQISHLKVLDSNRANKWKRFYLASTFPIAELSPMLPLLKSWNRSAILEVRNVCQHSVESASSFCLKSSQLRRSKRPIKQICPDHGHGRR